MMTAYRELKDGAVETLELDVHLEGCTSCRQELARYTFIGEQLRSLPAVEPLPDMHTKLMHALAKSNCSLYGNLYPEQLLPLNFSSRIFMNTLNQPRLQTWSQHFQLPRQAHFPSFRLNTNPVLAHI